MSVTDYVSFLIGVNGQLSSMPAAASTFVAYELTMEFLQKHTAL